MAHDIEALDATLHTLNLSLEAIPARPNEQTAYELLALVNVTFHDFVAAVLIEPKATGTLSDDPPLPTRAAFHARSIADLLTALAISHWRNTDSKPSGRRTAVAPAALTQHWIAVIAEAARDEHRPRYDTASEYVRGAASSLCFAERIIGAERGLSIDPDDPRGAIERPDDAATSEDAGALLIWTAASAVCIAATLEPQFRIGPSS